MKYNTKEINSIKIERENISWLKVNFIFVSIVYKLYIFLDISFIVYFIVYFVYFVLTQPSVSSFLQLPRLSRVQWVLGFLNKKIHPFSTKYFYLPTYN